MSTRFGPVGLRLMNALARVVGAEDVKGAPDRMRTDELIPVIAVDPGMAAGGQVQLQAQVSLAGLSQWGWQAVGFPDSLTTPAFPPQALFPLNAELESVVLGINLEVQYSAPPALPPIGSVMRLEELRQAAGNPTSMIECSVFDPVQYTDGVRWQYFWSYPMWQSARFWSGGDPSFRPNENAPIMAASPIYIPAGSKWGLRMQLWNPDMTGLVAWPAGTLLNARAFLSTAPRGMRPPGM